MPKDTKTMSSVTKPKLIQPGYDSDNWEKIHYCSCGATCKVVKANLFIIPQTSRRKHINNHTEDGLISEYISKVAFVCPHCNQEQTLEAYVRNYLDKISRAIPKYFDDLPYKG